MDKRPRRHLYAAIRQPRPEWRCLSSVVLFAMRGIHPYEPYLAIRYESFEEQLIDGDSFCLTIEEAMTYAEEEFGVSEADWKELSAEDVARIPLFVAGRQVHSSEF